MGFEILRGFNADDIMADLAGEGDRDKDRAAAVDELAPGEARPESIDLNLLGDGATKSGSTHTVVVDLSNPAE